MSLTSNINDVAFASSLTIDKVVRIYSGSFNAATDLITRNYTLAAAPNPVNFYRIAHGLTRPAACESMWSLDNSIFYDGGLQNSSNQSSIAYSDSTYIYMFTPVAVGTVYYKIWCSWIDDFDTTNPSIAYEVYPDNPVQFDSRENYQKISDQNVLTFTAGTFGATETQSVSHSFSYIPNAKVWFEAFAGEVWPLNAGGATNPFLIDDAQDECQLSIDSNSIDVTLTKFSNASKRAWYKCYYDATT